jgi:2-dehydro-3-deoxyphosphogluconate aldolase/(4S)-4-hydroxy-2-oxoglutarate aldolase
MNVDIKQEDLRLVAILRGVSLSQAMDTTAVFVEAGIKAVEVTYNTMDAPEIIRHLRDTYGGQVIIGAGTVMTTKDVVSAGYAGASFILSPDCNPEVIKATKDSGLFSAPGAFTATEVVMAHKSGADMVKLFPAGRLGPGYVKDLLGPLNGIKFMAVGGIDLTNAAAFLAAGAKSVGVGSSLVDMNLIGSGDFVRLKQLAIEYVKSTRLEPPQEASK